MKKFLIGLVVICSLSFFSACNVTRVVTTEARSYSRGDTAVHITTRTVETYDAKKNLNY